jgi:hypothetical protein
MYHIIVVARLVAAAAAAAAAAVYFLLLLALEEKRTMSRGKDSKKKTGDGKHRNETKEERRLRLQGQEEAREVSHSVLDSVCHYYM